MLSDQEKTNVRFYLGQGALFRYLNPRLESVFTAIDADAEAIIRNILSQLAALDVRIFGAVGQTGYAAKAAGVKAVEEIQFSGNSGDSVFKGLCRQARTLVARLSDRKSV